MSQTSYILTLKKTVKRIFSFLVRYSIVQAQKHYTNAEMYSALFELTKRA